MLNRSQLKRSAVIAAIVGSLLTVTNQYEAVIGEQPLNVVKIGVTYAIPFFVSLFSALMEKKRMMRDFSLAQNFTDSAETEKPKID